MLWKNESRRIPGLREDGGRNWITVVSKPRGRRCSRAVFNLEAKVIPTQKDRLIPDRCSSQVWKGRAGLEVIIKAPAC